MWTDLLGSVDVCVTPVLDLAEAVAGSPVGRDAELRDVTAMRQVGLPVTWSDGEPMAAPGPAPGLGEHTAELLAELGYDQARMSGLQQGNSV